MINEYVFVAQGEIFAPLAAKPAERARSFQKLFGVSRAEKCWEALGEFLIQVRDQDRNLPDLDDVRARLSSAVTAVANWSEDVARYDDVAHWRESDDPDYIKLQAHQRGAEVTDRLEPLQVLIATCVEEKTRAESRIAELESQADRLSTACDAGHDEYGRAKGLLATHQLRVANRATRHRLESQLQAQLDEDQAFTPPEKPENYIPPEERETISDTINELKIEQRKCDHLLAYFAEPGSAHHKSECPTCGTHVDDIDVDADALRARLDGIQAEMDGLVMLIPCQSTLISISAGPRSSWICWSVISSNCVKQLLNYLQMSNRPTTSRNCVPSLTSTKGLRQPTRTQLAILLESRRVVRTGLNGLGLRRISRTQCRSS